MSDRAETSAATILPWREVRCKGGSCRRLGFKIVAHPEDRDVVIVQVKCSRCNTVFETKVRVR